MGAPKRVPDQRIRAALEARQGNVQAMSEDLGLARNNLYARMRALGLDPDNHRPAALKVGNIVTKHGRLAIRVKSEHEQALREAKYDLQAKLRRDMDEGSILAAFFEEAFSEWLKAKLS